MAVLFAAVPAAVEQSVNVVPVTVTVCVPADLLFRLIGTEMPAKVQSLIRIVPSALE